MAALAVAAPPAAATSAKVGIGDFRWSQPEVTVAVGDSVTWFWVGPDFQHSVTALDPPNGVDSDPGDGAPDHGPGDRFGVTFDEPGTYEFHCKLHALVRGRVTVVDDPAQAGPAVGPDPQLFGDVVAPELTEVRWGGLVRFRRTTELRYTLDEPARLTFDVMRRRPGPDRLMGTARFRGHIGWNRWDFRGVLGGRRLPAGRYYALVVARDATGNQTGDVRLGLRIRR